jgi:GT2 family glycosyltransferase
LVNTPYVLFLDDDVELLPNYIETMEELFDNQPKAILSTGKIIQEGANYPAGIDRKRAELLLATFVGGPIVNITEAYGCNMFVRTEIAKKIKFDENLPLYGWLEDLDFSIRSREFGQIVHNQKSGLVHLATVTGRGSEVRYGYSQIANPYYIWRKLSSPTFKNMLLNHWARYTIANLAYTICFWAKVRGDRPGRLQGNARALFDLMIGRMHPTRIMEM